MLKTAFNRWPDNWWGCPSCRSLMRLISIPGRSVWSCWTSDESLVTLFYPGIWKCAILLPLNLHIIAVALYSFACFRKMLNTRLCAENLSSDRSTVLRYSDRQTDRKRRKEKNVFLGSLSIHCPWSVQKKTHSSITLMSTLPFIHYPSLLSGLLCWPQRAPKRKRELRT